MPVPVVRSHCEGNRDTPSGRRGDGSSAATKKVKGQRAVALCPFTTTVGQFLVSKLIRDVALFVDLAIRALCLDSVAACPCPWRRTRGRHHQGLNERLRIFDRHVVADFIANTGEFLDDVHAAGVEEAPSSQPRRIDEIDVESMTSVSPCQVPMLFP